MTKSAQQVIADIRATLRDGWEAGSGGRVPNPFGALAEALEDHAEERAARRRGDDLSESDLDYMADRAADRYYADRTEP